MAASTVETVENAAGCPQTGDFHDYFTNRVKTKINIQPLVPKTCEMIPAHTTLSLAGSVSGSVVSEEGKQRLFFRIRSLSDSTRLLWIPSEFVTKPKSN